MTTTVRLDPARLRRVAWALDMALWAVAFMVGLFSLANVHGVAVGHDTVDPQAWLLAPIVDVALFAGITADSVLSRYGMPPHRWGAGLRWFCGLATWTLNVWDAAASLDPGAIVVHSVPPVVLILLAEAAPRYRQQFAALTAGPAAVPAVKETPAVPATADSSTTESLDAAVPAVPAPRTGTATSGRPGTPARRRTGTGHGTRKPPRPDTELIALLADVRREPDGTVPIRRAATALECGTGRAERLLAAQGLLRPRTADTPTSAVPNAA